MRPPALLLVLPVLLACVAPPAEAQLPLGPAFAVNSVTSGNQNLPDVAMRPDGFGWFVWTTFGGTDTPNVSSRSFDTAGALGSETTLNQFVTGIQRDPHMDVNAAGNRAVSWWSLDQFGPNSDEDTIVRWSHGFVLQDEELAQGDSGPDPEATDVAIHSDDSFVAVWREGSTLTAHRFTPTGISAGDDETIAVDANLQTFAVAALPAGRSVVVFNAPAGDSGVYGRLVAADGSGVGFPFPLSELDDLARSSPQVDSDLVGGFVAVWKDYGTNLIMARRFRADATPIGGDLQISEAPLALATTPYVAVGPDGSFVVVWNERQQVAADYEVWAREFTRTGVPVGGQFLIEGATDAFVSGIAMGSSVFVTAWSAPDADIYGVWGRRYTRRVVFADGFEDGTIAYW